MNDQHIEEAFINWYLANPPKRYLANPPKILIGDEQEEFEVLKDNIEIAMAIHIWPGSDTWNNFKSGFKTCEELCLDDSIRRAQ